MKVCTFKKISEDLAQLADRPTLTDRQLEIEFRIHPETKNVPFSKRDAAIELMALYDMLPARETELERDRYFSSIEETLYSIGLISESDHKQTLYWLAKGTPGFSQHAQ